MKIVKNKDFLNSDTEIQSYESIEKLIFHQENDDEGNNILDGLNEKEMNDPRVQAFFKISRQNILSIFIIFQDYNETPMRTIRANGNIYHIFELNNFRDVQNLFQDKISIDMTLNELKLLTSSCWNEKFQPLTIDMTKNKYTGRYRLRLNSVFVPNSSSF